VGKGTQFLDALKKADEVLLHATQGISRLVTTTGIINVDFADVRTVMQNGGAALMGTGIGRGENRALEAAQQAISSPLLDNVSISGASAVLLNIVGGDDLTLGEATQISEIVHDAVGEDAEIIFGAGNDPAMHGEIRVTVIATGFDRAREDAKGANIISFPAKRREERPVAPVVNPPMTTTATPAPNSLGQPGAPGQAGARLRRAGHGDPHLHPAADGLMRFGCCSGAPCWSRHRCSP
jgi:cell division protein FtsZ